MHTTLFGSAFNPPHLGHALVIHDFLAQHLCDQLWLLPNVTHSFGKHMAPTNHRLAMTQLFLKFLQHKLDAKRYPLNAIKLCPIEIDLNLSGRTYDTLQALKFNPDYLVETMKIPRSKLPTTNYNFLIGSDQLPIFDKWYRYQDLLDQMPFFVYPRASHPNQPLRPGMRLLDHPHQTITNLSSTLIRHQLKAHQTSSLLLPPDIIAYINQHHLYQ